MQLRCENLRADSYNLVGFQNHLKFGEQARVLRLIPGLENAKFLRYGQIHRNTYINAPRLLTETLNLREHPPSSSPANSPASKATPNPSPPACSPASTPRPLPTGDHRQSSPRANRARLACPLHHARRFQALPTREYHLRPAAPLDEEIRRRIRDKKERRRIQCDHALAAFDSWWASQERAQSNLRVMADVQA